MIKAGLGHRIDGWVHALFPFLFWRRLNPHALTVCGALISMGAGFAFARGAFLVAGLLMLAGGFFDLVDGVVARHQGESSRFGAFLDSTVDRVVDMSVLLGLVIHYASVGASGWAALVGWVLMMSVVTSYARARAEHWLPGLEGGLLERGERVGLLAAGAILGWLETALVLLALGTTWTVVQRTAMAYRALAALPEDAEPPWQANPQPQPEPPWQANPQPQPETPRQANPQPQPETPRQANPQPQPETEWGADTGAEAEGGRAAAAQRAETS